MNLGSLQEQRAHYRAVHARVRAPQDIVLKARPRAYRPSAEACRYLAPAPREISTQPMNDSHVRDYLIARLRLEGAELLPKHPPIGAIVQVISTLTGVLIVDIQSARRDSGAVRARQLAMYLARILTPQSYPDIGRRIGGRDHTTVMHAVKRVDAGLATDPDLVLTINKAKTILRERFP